MPTHHQSKIPQQSEHLEHEVYNIPPSPSISISSNSNLLNQAFIVYSDDQIMSQSCNSSASVMSRRCSDISSYSSFSQLQNVQGEQQKNSILGSLSQSNEESSILDLHVSQCSDSGIELIKGLGPLFGDKAFLRRSPRFAVYGAGIMNEQKQAQDITQKFKQIGRKQLESEMIEDQKFLSGVSMQNSSKIVQQNCQNPLNIFMTNLTANNRLDSLQVEKVEEFNPLARLTRSSKRLLLQETQSSNSSNKRQNDNLQNSGRGSMNSNDYVSKITKEYILLSRKQKRIKKIQQKQFQYGLRGFRKESKSFKRGFN